MAALPLEVRQEGQHGKVGMSREAARKIVNLLIKQGAEQNAILAEVQTICSDDEFERYRRMIGQSMGCMLLDVINPIVELYPDLKPTQLE
jgi:hypothetical protein